MARQQTFIIYTFSGAETYTDALCNGNPHNFYRVGCKKIDTCRKYIKSWHEQASGSGWEYLYKSLLADDGRYEIEQTPNGYDGKVVERGFIRDLL
jgi:hypothetical protein